jgi:hypothetical protein
MGVKIAMNRSFMSMGKKGGGVGLLQPDIGETQKAGRNYYETTPLYWREVASDRSSPLSLFSVRLESARPPGPPSLVFLCL